MNPSIEAPSERRLWTRAWDAVVDANPVIAKELLVTARTPMFVGSIVGAPLVLAAVVLLVRSTMREEFDAYAGLHLFTVYFTGLSIALGLFGAALGSTVVVQERDAGMLEALRFSALGVRRIVFGKFAAVLLAEAALVVGTLPLFAFVLARGGTSLGEALVAMSIASACGIMAASIGIAVSANERNTRRSLLVSLVGAGVAGIGVVIWLALASDLARYDGPFGVARSYFEASRDARYFAVLFALPAYSLAGVLWLGHAAATSGLMDPSEDRGRPIKRWMLGVYAAGVVSVVVCCGLADKAARETIAVVSTVAAAVLAIVLLFVFVGEPLRPTRRMLIERATRRGVLLAPCLVPSILLTVLASGAVLLVVPILAGNSDAYELGAFWAIALLAVVGGLMGSVAAYRGPSFARRVGAIGLAVLTILFVLGRSHLRGPTGADLLCPLALNPERDPAPQVVFVFSLFAWSAAALVSMALLVRASRAQAARVATPLS